MNVDSIRALEPTLREYLDRFADCFSRSDTRAHFPRYVEGQLSNLERKSVEPMALSMNVPVRTLQEFLSQHKWDQELMRDRVQQIVREEQGGDGSRGETIGIFDETSAVKKGDKTPSVQRQHCGGGGQARELYRDGQPGVCFAGIFIASWMPSCSCRKVGLMIASVAGKRGFPMRWSTAPRAKSPGNNTGSRRKRDSLRLADVR